MSVVEMKVPVIGESITEVTLSQWLVADGEYVEMDQPICEFESDKATLEFPAEAAGKLIHVAKEESDLAIGALVARIDTSATNDNTADSAPAEQESAPKEEDKEAPAPQESAPKPAATPAKENYATGHPSPAAGKIMTENKLESASIQGSGKDGRITKDDAQKAADKQAAAPAKEKEQPAKPPRPIATTFSRESSRKKMSRMRRTIATRLVRAKNETAMLTTFNEVDLTAVMELRKRVQDKFVEKYGIKLGFMSLFAKACAQVLLEMPDVNAMLDENEVVYHDFVDISIAISTPTGLVVPPVRNVESLNFAEIEQEIKRLATKARNNDLSLEDMQGGTFTITNGGVFGSLLSTPIINEPQSAILGMHNIVERPVALNGQVVIRPMMYIALSYDHRVIDGSTSVTFLVKVKERLENPDLLLLGI